MVFLSSVSADRAIDLLLKKKWQKIPAVCIALLVIVLPSAVKLNRSPVDVDERYQQAADYIMTANDVHDPHTAIFCSSYVTRQGWDYYLTHNGKRDGKYVFYSKEISTPEDVADIDVVYYFKVHKEPDEIMKSILNEEFHSVHTDTESGVVKYERN